MNQDLLKARENFIQGMSRISSFWGFPRAMGAMFGAIYLSPEPLSLDDIGQQVGVSKGAVSTHVRSLERLGMVHKHIQLGDRKDYYFAETDFWKVVKRVLREREQQEFDHALRSVGDSLALVQEAEPSAEDKDLSHFYEKRMENMQRFFNSLDNMVATFIALDELRNNSIQRLFGRTTGEPKDNQGS